MLKKALKKETGKAVPLYKFENNYGSFFCHTIAESKDRDEDYWNDRGVYRIQCEVIEEQDPFCCGVYSLGDWNLEADEDVTHEAKVRLVTHMLREIIKTRDYYQATTTEPHNDAEARDIYKVVEAALLRAGFKNTTSVKSNHGNYPIRVWHYFGKPYDKLLK